MNVPAASVGYGYDPNGNTTSKTEGTDTWTYEWDAENRLKRVLKNGAEQARFAYDALGRRIERVIGTTTIRYLYDRTAIVRETTDGVPTLYVHGAGIDHPLAREDNAGTRTYYHTDGLRSIVRETDSLGTATLSRAYDAFGNLRLGMNDGFAFTGREWDRRPEGSSPKIR